MAAIHPRRYDKLYEQLLLSRWFSSLVGWLLTVILPAFVYWGEGLFLYPTGGALSGLVVSSLTFVLAHIGVTRLLSGYPGGRTMGMIIPQTLIIYALCMLPVLMLRVEVSRYLLGIGCILAVIWFQIEYIVTEKFRSPKLAVVPGGQAADLLPLPGIHARELRQPDLEGVRYDAVVADFTCLAPEWERFLTRCALNRIPVHDARSVYESITGRVRINRMAENDIGSLLPSVLYERSKLVFDWALILLTLPVSLPLAALALIAVRLESPGPVIYTQERVGRGNKPFKIYKIRSMRFDKEAAPSQFAGEDDPRITRVGRVLRKYRIDELPQFVNILKGDMSLIGPRPEQPDFVAHFDQELPFYSYRHVVKPGITGWAQVRQGYAADVDQTREKIEHDFYYIKHGSLFLDVFILFLTVKTLLTGFGAR
jgi:lipopolysaccharide/colanic/teichoic acid biosynthesis glycosyltransferase